MKESDYIGFYSLRGKPYRIVSDATTARGVRGEYYRAGTGFVKTSLSEIIVEGKPVSESSFKELVLATMRCSA